MSKIRVIAEAEMTLEGCQHPDIDAIQSYFTDVQNVLYESEVTQRKAFPRSLVKKIVIDKKRS